MNKLPRERSLSHNIVRFLHQERRFYKFVAREIFAEADLRNLNNRLFIRMRKYGNLKIEF